MGSSLENFPESENEWEKRSSLEDTEHLFRRKRRHLKFLGQSNMGSFVMSGDTQIVINQLTAVTILERKQLNGDMEVPKVSVTYSQRATVNSSGGSSNICIIEANTRPEILKVPNNTDITTIAANGISRSSNKQHGVVIAITITITNNIIAIIIIIIIAIMDDVVVVGAGNKIKHESSKRKHIKCYTIQIGSSRRQAPISGATFASLRRVNCLAFTRNSLRIFSVAPGLKVATAAKFVLK
ncbi:hypothetical protein GQX74_001200 [Glossina fuscipes]|nr:hypothetical protein GQX74_001200 [Glossina fuscipes]